MEIKTFSNKYRNALRSIYLESRKSTFTWLDTSVYQLLDFDQDTEAERIHVALKGNDVLGFISVWEPENFIHHLYVSDHANGIGVGTQLLETAKNLSDKPLTLKCMSQNEMALKFYASKGFVIASQGSDDYCDYYLMTNNL